MSVQEKPWSNRWGWRGLLLGWILLAALSMAVSGCGNSSGEDDVTVAKARKPAPCGYGKPVAPHVPDAPKAWTSGPRPAIALTCSYDRVDPGAAIVGYPIPGGGACVGAYSSSFARVFDELCEPTGREWTKQCSLPGCVHYFHHQAKATVLSGPVPARVSGVWASIHGKQVFEGVVLASVNSKRMRAIGAKEPFGFFSVYIPRCVEPDEIKVHLVTGGSKQIGLADEWDVVEPKCPPERSGRS